MVLIFCATLIAVWLLMYANASCRPPRLPAEGRRQATIDWRRRYSNTEFRLVVERPEGAELIVVAVPDAQLIDLAAYVREIEKQGKSPQPPRPLSLSARRANFSLIDGGKE